MSFDHALWPDSFCSMVLGLVELEVKAQMPGSPISGPYARVAESFRERGSQPLGEIDVPALVRKAVGECAAAQKRP